MKFPRRSAFRNFVNNSRPPPPKPDSSGKPEGEERTKALKRIAGTYLYSSTKPALLKK